MENVQDIEDLQDMEAKHHTLHGTTIGKRIYIFFQVYNL